MHENKKPKAGMPIYNFLIQLPSNIGIIPSKISSTAFGSFINQDGIT